MKSDNLISGNVVLVCDFLVIGHVYARQAQKLDSIVETSMPCIFG